MPYKLRTFKCAGCGQITERRCPDGPEQRCVRCAIARSAENARQQHARSGEFYRRWADGIARAAAEAQVLAAADDIITGVSWP